MAFQVCYHFKLTMLHRHGSHIRDWVLRYPTAARHRLAVPHHRPCTRVKGALARDAENDPSVREIREVDRDRPHPCSHEEGDLERQVMTCTKADACNV